MLIGAAMAARIFAISACVCSWLSMADGSAPSPPAFATATAAGATVLRPLADMDYGSREFTVADPEGHQWSVGTYRPATG